VRFDHDKLVEEFVNLPEKQPGRCDDKLYREGEFFCCLAGPRSWLIEAWVQKIRKLSGVKVDWNMMGGRARLVYLGDAAAFQRLVEAANLTRPALEEAALKTSSYDFVRDGSHPSVQWLNPRNPWGEIALEQA